MPKIPRMKGKDLIKALMRAGFVVIRVKGSHHFLRHADGRCTVVPVHTGEIVGPGLMGKILRDCEIMVEEFQGLV